MGSGGHRSEGAPVARAPGADRAPALRRAHLGGVDDLCAVRPTGPAAGRAIRPARPAALVAVALTLAGFAGGCGGPAGGGDEPIGVEAPDRLTEPSARDPEDVRPYVEALLLRHQEIVNAVFADPTQVDDPSARLATEYLGLFEPDSEVADAIVDGWVDRADDGITMAPFDADVPIFSTRVDGAITATSDDEVRFGLCTVERSLLYEDGQLVQRVPFLPQPGEGTAVRRDGHWVLRRIDVLPPTGCESEQP